MMANKAFNLKKASNSRAADRRKIKSKTCVIDGITFDSKAEGEYYSYLKQQEAAGEIIDIVCQPEFVIQEGCRRFGKNYKPIKYTPDFLVTYKDGRKVAIDVKGYSMEDATLKRKLFVYQHPEMELKWVSQSGKYSETGWIDYDDLKKCRRAAKKAAAENKVSPPFWN